MYNIRGSLLSYNLYSNCEGNPINRIDLNGNFYIDMGTILIILNIALSYPTASLILCMGLKKFKKIIVNLFVKILAKFISVYPTTLSFVLSGLAMLIGLEIVTNFASLYMNV